MERHEQGFSLIETMIAMGILATALMTLAGVFVVGMQALGGSTPGLIAREKAREAIESVHTARDTHVITWDQIRNVKDGGIFLDGPQELFVAGDDGIVNTADDDDLGKYEEQRRPGADHKLGTADDEVTPLKDFTREVIITALTDHTGAVNTNLRQVQVIVRYHVKGGLRTYTLTTYISSYA